MKTLGQVAFEACREHVGNAHTGKPIPPWEELPERIRQAWEATASTVRDLVIYGTSFELKLKDGGSTDTLRIDPCRVVLNEEEGTFTILDAAVEIPATFVDIEDEKPCVRHYEMAAGEWHCVHDHTGCLYNDGHNTCMHPGESSSPTEQS